MNQFDDIELNGPLHLATEGEISELVDYLDRIGWLEKERQIQEATDKCLFHMCNTGPQPYWIGATTSSAPTSWMPSNQSMPSMPSISTKFGNIKVIIPSWIPNEYKRSLIEQQIREQIK